MENFKIKLDRPTVSSEEIASKQNFDHVLSSFNQASPPAYKNPWFWGSAGLASIGLTTVISLNALTINKETNEKNITLKDSSLPPDTECIKPPVKGENEEFKTYQVDPRKDEIITLESGTTIEIDKGSLLAKNTNEKVEIKVREFHDQSSIFISGIPMDYKQNAFESAGMIEIRGEQNGENVVINPDKAIEVNLLTHQNPIDFDFWKLNEGEQEWEKYPAKLVSDNQPKTSNSLPQLDRKIQEKTTQITSKSEAISSLSKPSVTEYKIPKKSAQNFDIDFNKYDFPELSAFKNIIFEVTSHGGQDPDFNENTDKIWSNMELSKKGDQYRVTFTNSSEKYAVDVRPILQGKELKKAQEAMDAALEDYQKTKTELENQKKELEKQRLILEQQWKEEKKRLLEISQQEIIKQQKLNRELEENAQKQLTLSRKINTEINKIATFNGSANFRIQEWGVYNCDKPRAYPQPMKNEIAFLWEGGGHAQFLEIFVFNMDKKNRYTYGTPNMPISNLGFHKNDDLVLIAIDAEGNLGYLELKKDQQVREFEKIIFKRKNQSIKTVDLLKRLLDETTAVA